MPADAPFDPTGYWVSIVSDEWRYRMLTPAKGNVDYVPVNAGGASRRAGVGSGEGRGGGGGVQGVRRRSGSCAFPARLHVTWQDVNTLKIEIDTGTQTRLLHFGESRAPAAEQPSLAGVLDRAVGDVRAVAARPASPAMVSSRW